MDIKNDHDYSNLSNFDKSYSPTNMTVSVTRMSKLVGSNADFPKLCVPVLRTFRNENRDYRCSSNDLDYHAVYLNLNEAPKTQSTSTKDFSRNTFSINKAKPKVSKFSDAKSLQQRLNSLPLKNKNYPTRGFSQPVQRTLNISSDNVTSKSSTSKIPNYLKLKTKRTLNDERSDDSNTNLFKKDLTHPLLQKRINRFLDKRSKKNTNSYRILSNQLFHYNRKHNVQALSRKPQNLIARNVYKQNQISSKNLDLTITQSQYHDYTVPPNISSTNSLYTEDNPFLLNESTSKTSMENTPLIKYHPPSPKIEVKQDSCFLGSPKKPVKSLFDHHLEKPRLETSNTSKYFSMEEFAKHKETQFNCTKQMDYSPNNSAQSAKKTFDHIECTKKTCECVSAEYTFPCRNNTISNSPFSPYSNTCSLCKNSSLQLPMLNSHSTYSQPMLFGYDINKSPKHYHECYPVHNKCCTSPNCYYFSHCPYKHPGRKKVHNLKKLMTTSNHIIACIPPSGKKTDSQPSKNKCGLNLNLSEHSMNSCDKLFLDITSRSFDENNKLENFKFIGLQNSKSATAAPNNELNFTDNSSKNDKKSVCKSQTFSLLKSFDEFKCSTKSSSNITPQAKNKFSIENPIKMSLLNISNNHKSNMSQSASSGTAFESSVAEKSFLENKCKTESVFDSNISVVDSDNTRRVWNRDECNIQLKHQIDNKYEKHDPNKGIFCPFDIKKKSSNFGSYYNHYTNGLYTPIIHTDCFCIRTADYVSPTQIHNVSKYQPIKNNTAYTDIKCSENFVFHENNNHTPLKCTKSNSNSFIKSYQDNASKASTVLQQKSSTLKLKNSMDRNQSLTESLSVYVQDSLDNLPQTPTYKENYYSSLKNSSVKEDKMSKYTQESPSSAERYSATKTSEYNGNSSIFRKSMATNFDLSFSNMNPNFKPRDSMNEKECDTNNLSISKKTSYQCSSRESQNNSVRNTSLYKTEDYTSIKQTFGKQKCKEKPSSKSNNELSECEYSLLSEDLNIGNNSKLTTFSQKEITPKHDLRSDSPLSKLFEYNNSKNPSSFSGKNSTQTLKVSENSDNSTHLITLNEYLEKCNKHGHQILSVGDQLITSTAEKQELNKTPKPSSYVTEKACTIEKLEYKTPECTTKCSSCQNKTDFITMTEESRDFNNFNKTIFYPSFINYKMIPNEKFYVDGSIRNNVSRTSVGDNLVSGSAYLTKRVFKPSPLQYSLIKNTLSTYPSKTSLNSAVHTEPRINRIKSSTCITCKQEFCSPLEPYENADFKIYKRSAVDLPQKKPYVSTDYLFSNSVSASKLHPKNAFIHNFAHQEPQEPIVLKERACKVNIPDLTNSRIRSVTEPIGSHLRQQPQKPCERFCSLFFGECHWKKEKPNPRPRTHLCVK